uniref:Lipocalin/cytosolic fatty-acid binding domain-containing protein n=1 Tax=Catagonus wagneri TaxID=51154 RepID=A0A8C3WW68_9CETA
MGPWWALWVLLSLPKAPRGQATSQTALSSVLQTFQKEQFQGQWFVLGLAGSTHETADRALLSPFKATFVQNENLWEVSYTMIRNKRCVTWSYVLIPETQAGRFSVAHRGGPGADPEELQVHDTDYASFALVLSRRRSAGGSVLRVSLLCRAWAIKTQELSRFVCLVQAQGLSDENVVFPDMSGNAPAGLGPDPGDLPPGPGSPVRAAWGLSPSKGSLPQPPGPGPLSRWQQKPGRGRREAPPLIPARQPCSGQAARAKRLPLSPFALCGENTSCRAQVCSDHRLVSNARGTCRRGGCDTYLLNEERVDGGWTPGWSDGRWVGGEGTGGQVGVEVAASLTKGALGWGGVPPE